AAAPPSADRVLAALAMTERALRLAPDDTDVQFTHAMLLLDGERAGLEGKADELVTWLVQFARSVQVNIAVRMADLDHPRFDEAVDIVLRGEPDEVPDELYASLADAIVERAPHQLRRLVAVLPDDVTLLGELAYKAIEASERDVAISLYDRLLELPFPDEGDDRTGYLRSLNNACIQAHAARAFEAAVRIADRAQAVAHENPYLYHSAACAYAAVGDYPKAFEQVKLAVEHEYDHLAQIEIDTDLGELLEWPAFQALFRAWHAEREGN
ncbi:MAG: hypothetical protein M3619_33440, partial [Myxococcota bacterium]|nr:hypothetical protein [Myxococcota bacterium]